MKAFPTTHTDDKGYFTSREHGMDLRDYFAAKALQGLAAHISGPKANHNETPQEAHARVAYEYADAMMEARK